MIDPKQDIRIIFTNPATIGTYIRVTSERMAVFMACDRINLADDRGTWHSADVVRRIYDVSDGLLTIVVAD